MTSRERRPIRAYFVGIVGEQGVGKSSVENRVFEQVFTLPSDPCYDGVPRREFMVDNHNVLLEISKFREGTEKEDPLFPVFYKQAATRCDVLLMVFSVTDGESLEKLKFHHEAILNAREQAPIPAIVMGNKCDAVKDRVVEKEEADMVAQSLGCKYFEISAKEDINVDEAMAELIREKWQRDEMITAAEKATEAVERRDEPDTQVKKSKWGLSCGKRCVVS